MSILNFLNKNHLAFIEEIVRNPFNSQHELAQIMKLSSRTIRNYVNHINRYSIEMGFEIIKTDNHYSIRVLDNRKYLVLLDYYSKEKKIKYDYNYLSDRISWYLYNFIFLENNLSIDDCSNKLNVSRSTVQSDLKRLNSLASEFNIEIKTHRQKGIILYGDETNIRLFALNNLEKGLKERIDNNQQILSTLTLKIIREKIINELEVKSKGSAREQTLYDFINLLIISILRVKNVHHIKELDFKYLVLIGTNEYKIVEDIFESHFPTLNTNEYQQDIAFLATTLVSERNNIDISGIQNMNQLKSLIKEINYSLEKQLGIHLNSDNALITNLENHLAEAIYRVYYDLPIYNPLTEDITFSYPFPFYIAQLFVLELEKYLSISFPNDEIAYLALHFSLFKDNQNNLKNIEKVILING